MGAGRQVWVKIRASEAERAGRAGSGGRRMEKKGGQKNGPRKTSIPKKKPKQVQLLPFDGGSEHKSE
jgi:hypothetical protein